MLQKWRDHQTTPTYDCAHTVRIQHSTAAIMPQILILLIFAQVWLSTSQFVFELEVDLDSVTAGDFSCEIGIADNDPRYSIYFPVFCLREGREDSSLPMEMIVHWEETLKE